MKTTEWCWSIGQKPVNPNHNYLGLGWVACGLATSRLDARLKMRSFNFRRGPKGVRLQSWAIFAGCDIPEARQAARRVK